MIDRQELSFDGVGINGPNTYRDRVATFNLNHPEWVKKYGPMFAAAPELLEAAKHTCDYLDSLIQRTRTPEVELILRKLRGELEDAIAKAEGK